MNGLGNIIPRPNRINDYPHSDKVACPNALLRHDSKISHYQVSADYIDLRERVYDFARQTVITNDNITMEINAILYYQITDPFKATYEIEDLALAIEN